MSNPPNTKKDNEFEFSVPEDAPDSSKFTFSVTGFVCPVCGSRKVVISIEPDYDNRMVNLTYDCPGGHLTTGFGIGRNNG